MVSSVKLFETQQIILNESFSVSFEITLISITARLIKLSIDFPSVKSNHRINVCTWR